MTNVLQTRGVDKRFDGLHALRSVDIEVAAGEIVGLFGPNGAARPRCSISSPAACGRTPEPSACMAKT
jgi:ABC-type lipopolysaccharide export system ATPase subunit